MKRGNAKIILGLFLIVLSISCQTNPGAKVPTTGLAAALHFCPMDSCEIVKIGSSTTQLPYLASEGIYDRWCVEVFYKMNNKTSQAAVEIIQTSEDPRNPFGWIASEPINNSDCSIYK